FESAMSTADRICMRLPGSSRRASQWLKATSMAHRHCIGRSVALVDRFELLVAPGQAHATAWQLYQRAGEQRAADAHRERAGWCALKIADSFAPEEPLRSPFP